MGRTRSGSARASGGSPRRVPPARSLAGRAWYFCLKRALQLAWVLLYRVRSTGQENIPASGPVLLVSNHQSHFDPPLVGSCCPRTANYMARETLFSFGPFGRLIASVNAFPIDRDGVGLAGVKETLRRLRRGEVVLVFPEGTRTPDGAIGPFRPGMAALAERSGAAVVPVGVAGAFEAWPRWRPLPRLGRVAVCFGPPLSPEEMQEFAGHELVEEVRRRVEQAAAVARRLRGN